MMTLTSATANKMLKQLNNELQWMYSSEDRDRTYIRISGEQPIIPDYNYSETRAKARQFIDKIGRLKHALNVFNTTTTVPDTGLTIDQLLVHMAMLNKEKAILERFRRTPAQAVRESIRCTNSLPEYDVANFDTKEAEADYKKLEEEIARMQTALDTVNSTVTFEVWL